MRFGELAGRYDERLRTEAFADVDASANGLQVGDRAAEVGHVAFAVDAAVATIEAAADAGSDALCVHHGLVWGGLERVTGRTFDRIAALIEHDLGLYVAHLPLDAHLELGNAAGVADGLDLVDRKPFGAHGAETIGLRGRLEGGPLTPEALAGRLEAALDGDDPAVRLLAFGPDDVEDVAVITGSGTDWIEETAESGVDVLVTGEGKQSAYHRAREAGVHLLLGGHYATETFGVRRLQGLAEEWGLETTYVDHPTGF